MLVAPMRVLISEARQPAELMREQFSAWRNNGTQLCREMTILLADRPGQWGHVGPDSGGGAGSKCVGTA